VAGEKEHEKMLQIIKDGVPIVPNLRKDIGIMQRELGLDLISFAD